MDSSTSFWQSVVNFLYSNFFIGLATLLVGFAALFVYRKQKIDKKQDAANIILLEIKNAETKLGQARDTIIRDGVLPETVFALRTASWDEYSYLFVRDFTDKEWELINTFYEKCRLYDEAADYNNTFFKKNEEQIRVNLHSVLAQYTQEYAANLEPLATIEDEDERTAKAQQLLDNYKATSRRFAEIFMDEITNPGPYFYRPQKPLTDAQPIISTIRLDLSTSTVGSKLENIITANVRSRFADFLVGRKATQR